MAESSPHTRVSRSRRAIALMAWGLLIITAVFLWDARQTGSLTVGASPISASLLAAFSAFVAVFAWMLFNANRRRSTDSFAAAAATLFPPPIIAFCLIASDSPLRWWMAFGIGMLVVIAVLSHVPDEFFGVPRGRSSYLVPLPVFDRMEKGVLDPNASWFTFNDLSQVVTDTERPSLAPRAYLNRETETRTTTAATAYSPSRPVSTVDDILGTDYDLGLLDDSLMDFELENLSDAHETTPAQRQSRTRPAGPPQQQFRPSPAEPVPRTTRQTRSQPTYQLNPLSRRLSAAVGQRKKRIITANLRHRMDRRERHASSIQRQSAFAHDSAIEQRSSALSPAVELDIRSSNRPSPAIPQVSPGYDSSSSQEQYPSTERTVDRHPQAVSGAPPLAPAAPRSFDFDIPTTTPTPAPTPTPARTPTPTPSSRRPETKVDSQPVAPATAYFQETNQNRADRHRARDEDSSARYQSPATAQPVAESRQQTAASSPRIDDQPTEPRRGGSIFGVPLPFGIGGRKSAPEEPVQEFVESNRSVPDTSQYPPSVHRAAAETDQAVQKFTSSVPAERTPPAAPPKQQRRSRYEDEAETVAPPQERQPSPTPVQPAAKESASTTHFERTKDEHGSELVEGVMTIRFDKGQKRANLHIPFSPPLPGMPDVECECVGDVPVRLKVPVRQSYGIRIEARRTNADEELEADVGFAAVYTPE